MSSVTNMTMDGATKLGGTVAGKDDMKSCTLYVYKDSLFHKVLGFRGKAVLSGQRGQRMAIRVEGKGLYAAPTDFGPGACVRSSVLPPTLLSAGCTVGAYSPVFSKYEIDLGSTVVPRQNANAATGIEEFFISGRTPKGSLDPEAVLEATKSFWADWRAGTAQTFNVGPVGSASGNIIEINCPKAQIEKMAYGDRDGRLTYEIPLHLAGNAGDDEVTITFT